MPIPTQQELYEEVDRRFHDRNPGSPDRLDPDNKDHAQWVHDWLQLRDDLVNEWSNQAFFEYFPDAGKLDPSDPNDNALIEYWLDIRDRIRDDAAPRYDLDSVAKPPDPTSSGTNPYAGTIWEPIWDDGYAAGFQSPGVSLMSPAELPPDEQQVWQAGVYEGQLAADDSSRGHRAAPLDTDTTVTQHPSEQFGLPSIEVELAKEPLGRAWIDTPVCLVEIEITLEGTITVHPPQEVEGLSVDESGYAYEVQQGVEGLFSGMNVSGVTGSDVGQSITIGTSFGSDYTAAAIDWDLSGRITFKGQVNLPPLRIPTTHGEASVDGDLALTVGVRLHPKQPVESDEPWYEATWDWVSDHAVAVSLIGAGVVGIVVITAVSGGTGTAPAAAGLKWLAAAAAL